jgi:hypothetical protein
MSTPKKPKERPSCVPAPAPSDARPRDLTPAELELVTAYTGMTPWARSLVLDTARKCAKQWPINRAPSLRMVKGGKS